MRKLWAILFILVVASGVGWAQAPTLYWQGATSPGALSTSNATATTDAQGRAVMVPFGQSQGTATNDNAAAGKIGEYVESIVISPGGSLTTATPANVTSIALTAGDWDVNGACGFLPAGTTTIQAIACGVSQTSAVLPAGGLAQTGILYAPFTTGNGQSMTVGPARISVAGPTAVYLVANTFFGVSTMTGYGQIRARRVR